jgi:hypothetical protein
MQTDRDVILVLSLEKSISWKAFNIELNCVCEAPGVA